MSCPNLKGKQLATLSKLENLHSLSVTSAHIDDSVLAAVAKCRHLNDLTLGFGSHRSIDARAFAHLKELPRLEVLWISHGITDDGLREIAAVPHLWWFTCSSYDVTDRGIEHFRGNQTIGQFVLFRAEEVTDKSIDVFASMTALKELEVDIAQISAAGRQSLATSRPDIKVTP
jgi:hypothetical protein